VSRLRARITKRTLLFVALAAALGTVGVEAKYRNVQGYSVVPAEQQAQGLVPNPLQTITVGGRTTVIQNPLVPSRPGLACVAGQNGGATDTGVTATRIRLASTMVQSGIGASFLGQSPIGMQAVVQKINRAGGICGRILELRLVDDGWRADLGQSFIQNFIKEGYFALPVVPSSEGLTQAITARDIGKARIPVVGSDGMLIQQYQSPWVWPVATATVSTMRIMAKHGYAKGSRSFAIVYDARYKFGKEGADAFQSYVHRLPGATLKAFVDIQPGQASYSSEIQEFNTACKDGCDFVAMLLEPATAETWIAGRPRFGAKLTSGAQTLFNERFAKNCGAPCEGMLVWTGYNPPIGTLASLPGVRQYVNDVRSISPTADETNQFLQGAYLGMSVFVDALQRVGPNLTRAGLKQVLDHLTYSSDLSSPLAWTAARRFANTRAQAFSIVVAQGSFAGFRNEQTGFIPDPGL
jgi:ABC-type branched-subunit amino acid transport system substrate-binding protein